MEIVVTKWILTAKGHRRIGQGTFIAIQPKTAGRAIICTARSWAYLTWETRFHKPTMTGDGKKNTHKNGSFRDSLLLHEWGLQYPLLQLSAVRRRYLPSILYLVAKKTIHRVWWLSSPQFFFGGHKDAILTLLKKQELKLYWLVVLTMLKTISQWEGLSHILWKKMFETTNQMVYCDLGWFFLTNLAIASNSAIPFGGTGNGSHGSHGTCFRVPAPRRISFTCWPVLRAELFRNQLSGISQWGYIYIYIYHIIEIIYIYIYIYHI